MWSQVSEFLMLKPAQPPSRAHFSEQSFSEDADVVSSAWSNAHSGGPSFAFLGRVNFISWTEFSRDVTGIIITSSSSSWYIGTSITFILALFVACIPKHHRNTIIRPPGTTVQDGLIFYPWCFFFATLSPRPLDRSPWNFATWSESGRILWIDFKNSGGAPQKKIGGQNMQNFGQFLTTSDFDSEYLRNKATYPQSERRTN